jgi:hypothetical protein
VPPRLVAPRFRDHHAPPLALIAPFCRDVAAHLARDPRNVAAIHCKARPAVVFGLVVVFSCRFRARRTPPARYPRHTSPRAVLRFTYPSPLHTTAARGQAGKGRTGLLMACYLLHCRAQTSARDALAAVAAKRTTDGKCVTIPSQLRYVKYVDPPCCFYRLPSVNTAPPSEQPV